MSTLAWILVTGFAMAAIAMVGSLTLVLRSATLERLVLPLVAFSAGSLLGGALFHLLPAAVERMGAELVAFGWVAAGFLTLFVLEQYLHWHHRHGDHRGEHPHRRPLVVLILTADGLHNLLGGLAVGGAFLVDVRLGLTTWVAALAHEVPQELGDFGVLVHGGMGPRRALAWNLASGLTFPLGGILAYLAARTIDTTFLVPFAAGNFVYIAAADLVPEIHRAGGPGERVVHFAALAGGLGLLAALHAVLGHR